VDNLAGLAALVSLVFAIVVGARWARSRRPTFAFWALGLLIFAAAAAAQSLGESQGFQNNITLFRLFYLLGGALGVIYLALGTVYLLAPRRVAQVSALVLAVFTVVVAVDAFVATIPDPAKLRTPCGVMGGAYSAAAPITAAVIIFNILGTLIFAGGAAWSGWGFLRRGASLDRIICNVLLTVGALVIAFGFSAAKISAATGQCSVGSLDYLGGYELAGMVVMFAGFMSLGRVRLGAVRRSTVPPAAAGAG
jgi:hypothetical protein